MRKEIIIGISTAIGTTIVLYLAGKITQFPTVLVPSRAVVAFHAASCPDGWKEVKFTEGRFIIGVGESPGLTSRHLLETGGEEDHQLTLNEMPEHNHQASVNVQGNGFKRVSSTWKGGGSASDTYVGKESDLQADVNVDPIGGSGPHNNMPPYVALLFCEKE